MFGMFFFKTVDEVNSALLILTVIFIIGFAVGPGPIVWLYISEICNEQATSVDTVVNWFWTLVVSISTPLIFAQLGGYTYLIFGCISVLGFVYIFIFMKETKGLPQEQVKRLYHREVKEYDLVQ